MNQAWKRARGPIFTMVALILLLLVPMSQAGAKDTDAKRNLIGKNVVPQHGETEVLGSVIDVADNGDVIIRLSGTRAKGDRIVTVPAGQIRKYQDRVVFEGNEDQLYRMAERDHRDYRGYYNRDRDGRD